MANTLKDETWTFLLRRIKADNCTPFLGAGACYGTLPLGADIARRWSRQFDYPLGESTNLVEVAQYLAVQYDLLYPKDLILEELGGVGPPDFTQPDEPHAVLADLPLSLYMTTNYDASMFLALQRHRFRQPLREYCRWNELLQREPPLLPDGFQPHPATPLVFHLHGYAPPESLVLTEDDYLQFLANMARNPELLPPLVRRALSRSTCLFIGYRLADWNFRLLFEGLRATISPRSIAVLLPPGQTEADQQAAQNYLTRYYDRAMDLQVYWGTAREFCGELRRRWEALTHEAPQREPAPPGADH